jgi:lysophospholipase L1-like esterase
MEGEPPAMRLGISRHRHARPAPWRATARTLTAVAGGSFLVIALSGTAGAGVTGPLGAAGPPHYVAAGPPHYVALGDSYTAGPLVPDQTGSPAGCLRSDHSYPYLVAAGTGAATFADVSCQGATTTDMTHSQSVPLGTNPPQAGALSAGTTLVTLQISGNDIGFSDIIIHCTTLSLTNPFGSPCKNHYTSGGTDRLRAKINAAAPKVAADLQGIHAGAPNARVLLVGYPVILPNSGDGCWPLVPIAFGDVPYLRGVEKALNAMLATVAAANNATFVDTYAASVGHDVCQGPGTKWVEGLIPTSPAVPFHPNRLGEQEMAQQVLSALG